jgi:hypothetical protein
MATGIHQKPTGSVRGYTKKTSEKVVTIVDAHYIADFIIRLKFNTREESVIDFLPLFHRYIKGQNLKYLSLPHFKKFILKNGNIYWGKNEDVIFSTELLYPKLLKEKEKILYII